MPKKDKKPTTKQPIIVPAGFKKGKKSSSTSSKDDVTQVPAGFTLAFDATLLRASLPPTAALQDPEHHHLALQLLSEGYTVLPNVVADPQRHRHALIEAEKHFMEYKDHSQPKVLGAFGAYGNPSSFHNTAVRQCFAEVHDACIRLFRCVASILGMDNAHVVGLLDRYSHRLLQTQTAESFHRDQSPDLHDWDRAFSAGTVTLAADTVFGGWTNLDDKPQYFSCLPSTHMSAAPNPAGGFNKLTAVELAWAQQQPDVRIHIPSGGRLVFFQNLVHQVLSGPLPAEHSYRLYSGFLLQNSADHRFQGGFAELEPVLDEMWSPRLPSGQEPRLYSQNHASALLYTHTLPWSAKTLIPEVTTLYTPASGPNQGRDPAPLGHVHFCRPPTAGRRRRPNFQPVSLTALAAMLGRELPYPPWTQEEKARLRPQPLL